MMTTYAFPSTAFPGPPRVSIDLPEEWLPSPMPGTLLAARGPLRGQAAPNLVIRYYTRAAGYGVEQALTDLEQFAQSRPSGRMDQPFQVDLDGAEATAVNLSWHEPSLGPVIQLHVLHASRVGGLVHLVHVSASVGGEQIEDDYATVQGIVQSFRTDGVTAPPDPPTPTLERGVEAGGQDEREQEPEPAS